MCGIASTARPKTGSFRNLALLAACSSGWVAGCGSADNKSSFFTGVGDTYTAYFPIHEDLVAEKKIKAEIVSGPGLDVSQPSVVRENNDLIITGTVTRQSGNDHVVTGCLDLNIIDRDGHAVDHSVIRWEPEDVPVSERRQSTYRVRMLGLPPPGSIIRISYRKGRANAAGLAVAAPTVAAQAPANSPARRAAWSPAATPLDAGTARVRVASVEWRKVSSRSADGKTLTESVTPKLVVTVEIANTDHASELTYHTWGAPAPAILTPLSSAAPPLATEPTLPGAGPASLQSDRGTDLSQTRYGFGDLPVGRVQSQSVSPDHALTDVLVFEPPAGTDPTSGPLYLELPAANAGGTGTLRFEIPASMVVRR